MNVPQPQLGNGFKLHEYLDQVNLYCTIEALRRSCGNVGSAAALLGYSSTQPVYTRMTKWSLHPLAQAMRSNTARDSSFMVDLITEGVFD